MPTFCYVYGLLGYREIECEVEVRKEGHTEEVQQYGDWLRASLMGQKGYMPYASVTDGKLTC